MKRLCICSQDTKLGYSSHRVTIMAKGEDSKSVPIEPLDSIEIYGNVQMSTQLLHELLKRNIKVGMYSMGGFYMGNINAPNEIGSSDLIKAQVLRSMDQEFKLGFAKRIITAKIHNQKIVLRRRAYEKRINEDETVNQINILEKRVNRSKSINELMGIEGNSAKLYFGGLGRLINEPFNFSGRSRRPSKDPFNSLINYGYSVLQNQVEGKITMSGLNPTIGMLHSSRGNKKALSFDIMEEWRPVIVDSLAFHCISARELKEDHFEMKDDGSIQLTYEGLKIYRRKLEDRFETSTNYIGDSCGLSFRKALNYQIDQYTKAILENDVSRYKPCRIR